MWLLVMNNVHLHVFNVFFTHKIHISAILYFYVCVIFTRGNVLSTAQVQVHPGNGTAGVEVSN